jgi:acyl carrier protein
VGRTLGANQVLAGSACGKRQHARPLNSVVSCQVGLDTLELILSTEELFGISITDEAAETVLTVGDFHSLVVAQLRASNRPQLNEDIVMDQLRTLICHHLAVSPAEVTPGARFREDLRAD